MKWSPLLVALVAVPVLRVAAPQRSAARGPTPQGSVPGPRYVPVDYDLDERIDAFAIEPSGRGRLLAQLPDGGFEDRTEAAGLATIGGVASAYWRDLTNDLWPDLLVVRPDGRIALYLGNGQSFVDETGALEGLVSPPVQAVSFQDHDLNGWIDLGLLGPDGSLQVVLHHGDLVFAPGELGPGGGGLRITSLAPAGSAVVTAPSPSGGGAPLGTLCADQVLDQATSQCLNASSTPALGQLYPLTSHLNVDTAGRVGINTTTPQYRLDVSGEIRSTAGFRFPDGSLQTSATSVGEAGPPGPQGPEGEPGTQLPAGTILMWGGSSAPSGFLLCNGSPYDPGQYPELAAAIGMTYGGGTSFVLPDMTQRFPMGADVTPGVQLGDEGGSLSHTHSIPGHRHGLGSLGMTTVGNHAHPVTGLTVTGDGSHTHSGSTNTDGAHEHGFVASQVGNNTAFDNNNPPSGIVGHVQGGIAAGLAPVPIAGLGGSDHSHAFSIGSSGSHGHDVGGSMGTTGDHFHTLSGTIGNVAGPNGDSAMTSDPNGAGTSIDRNPPFVSVNFIIKT